jgi:hypothetical protein
MTNLVPIKKNYYVDEFNGPKKNGIYCSIFDRWLLIDNYDYSMTLETAKLLSSKIASTVYILPNQDTGMDNDNCLNYTLLNKIEQRKPGGSDLFTSQIPTAKTLKENQIYDIGIPEDYKSNESFSALMKLKKYSHLIHRCVYAISIVEKAYGSYNTSQFASSFFPEQQKNFDFYVDSSEFEHGALNEIKKILYYSLDTESAIRSINDVWKNQDKTLMKVLRKFYYVLFEEEQNYDFK